MDFSVIFQLRTKKFWWMDVIFYFVLSLLVATVFCYFIFSYKNGTIRDQIKEEVATLQTVGTQQQKQREAEVTVYQKKIGDFALLLKNHEFASNVFDFMQAQTMPNIWFSQFSLDAKNRSVQLNGETDNLDDFSRQVAALERNKYVNSVGTFSSSLGEAARMNFNISMTLDSSIFGYLPDISPNLIVPITDENGLPITTSGSSTDPLTPGARVGTTTPEGDLAPSSGPKLINSFHLLDPDVVGAIDQTAYTVTINVPSGTNVKKLKPIIVTSSGDTVKPETLVEQDFTSPVIYSVTGQDGTFQDYKVTVIVDAPVQLEEKSGNTGSLILISILIVVAIIVIIIGVVIFLKKRPKKI